MVDTERLRKYHYNRVLIESARILSPQFADAVVFLSGAQIEMLRNVSQYLNRLDTYVSEYQPGYYLVPTDEDFDDILEIVADMEETLMGNPNTIWGYEDRWMEYKGVESTGAGTTYVSTNAVPAGYVYVLEHWNIYHLDDDPCGMTLGMGETGGTPILYTAPAVPGEDVVYETTHITLKESDYLTLAIVGLPNESLARMRVWGHKMVVPE